MGPVLLSLVLLAPPALAANRPHLDDDDIARAVNTELALKDGVRAYDIDVSVQNGVVTLTGAAGSLLAKDRAARIAEGIKGVRAVVDRATVRPSQKSDAAIASDVEDG